MTVVCFNEVCICLAMSGNVSVLVCCFGYLFLYTHELNGCVSALDTLFQSSGTHVNWEPDLVW